MFFFVVSGFLEAYNHLQQTRDKKDRRRKERILPIIWSGNISTTFSFICWILMGYSLDIFGLIGLVISYIFVQCWIPSVYYHYSFSTVTWFLGAIFFFYLLTPHLIKLCRKIKRKDVALAFLVILKFLLEILFTYKLTGTMLHYFTYVFPPYRLVDDVCGLLTGSIFIEKAKRSNTIFEIMVIVLFAVSSYMSSNIPAMNYGTLLLIPSLLLIYIFAQEKGVLSKVFGGKTLCYIGARTQYYFVFHISVLHYTRYYIESEIIGGVIALITTVILTETFLKIRSKCSFTWF